MYHTASDTTGTGVQRATAPRALTPRDADGRAPLLLAALAAVLTLALAPGLSAQTTAAEAGTAQSAAPDGTQQAVPRDAANAEATHAALQEAEQAPQDATDAALQARRLVGYATDTDGDGALLELEFAGGRQVAFELRDGRVYIEGRRVPGTYEEGGALDRSWRDLLRGLDGPAAGVAERVIAWEPTGEGIEQALDDALDDYLSGAAGPEAYGEGADVQALGGAGDSVTRLNVRIQELEELVEELQSDRERIRAQGRTYGSYSHPRGPFHDIWDGIRGILGTMLKYVVLLAIGVATVYFGGRPYLETVADAARRQPVRAWAVGFAGTFLAIPAFIIGILVLVVSVVGIPALLVWVPGFPIAVVLSLLLGFLAVAHGAGEVMAERRFQGIDWLQRANSFHYLMTGLGLLFALPLAAHAISMVGFLGFIEGLLWFVGGMAIWLAFTIGFGAVLMTRAGTRQPDGSRTKPATAERDLVDDEEDLVV